MGDVAGRSSDAVEALRTDDADAERRDHVPPFRGVESDQVTAARGRLDAVIRDVGRGK